jgi:hypothetical protein
VSERCLRCGCYPHTGKTRWGHGILWHYALADGSRQRCMGAVVHEEDAETELSRALRMERMRSRVQRLPPRLVFSVDMTEVKKIAGSLPSGSRAAWILGSLPDKMLLHEAAAVMERIDKMVRDDP